MRYEVRVTYTAGQSRRYRGDSAEADTPEAAARIIGDRIRAKHPDTMLRFDSALAYLSAWNFRGRETTAAERRQYDVLAAVER